MELLKTSSSEHGFVKHLLTLYAFSVGKNCTVWSYYDTVKTIPYIDANGKRKKRYVDMVKRKLKMSGYFLNTNQLQEFIKKIEKIFNIRGYKVLIDSRKNPVGVYKLANRQRKSTKKRHY